MFILIVSIKDYRFTVRNIERALEYREDFLARVQSAQNARRKCASYTRCAILSTLRTSGVLDLAWFRLSGVTRARHARSVLAAAYALAHAFDSVRVLIERQYSFPTSLIHSAITVLDLYAAVAGNGMP